MDNQSGGGIGSYIWYIILMIIIAVVVGGIVALGIYFSAATRDCTKNEDCLKGVIGYEKCFIEQNEAKGKCKECGTNGDCPKEKPYCMGGKCMTEVPTCTKSTDCRAANPYCSSNGLCTDTNCTTDSDCSAMPGTPTCVIPAGMTRGVCSQTPCTANTDCGNIFSAAGSGRRCINNACTHCTKSADCGPNFSCIDTKCVFDPLNPSTGNKWNFYPDSDITGLPLRVSPNFPQDSLYSIDDLLVKAEAGGIDIFKVYDFNPATGKGKAKFYSYAAPGYRIVPSVTAYTYNINSKLNTPNGVFVSNIHAIPPPLLPEPPTPTPLPVS